MKTVAYFVESKTYGGSEKALLQLIAGIDRTRWRPILFYRPEPGIAPLISQVRQLDVATQAVPWLRDWRAPGQLLAFARKLRAENVAVLHASLHWHTACRAAVLAGFLAGVPAIIATVQLFKPNQWDTWHIWQQRAAARLIDQYIAVSNATARNLQNAFHLPPSKISVIHNSVPLEHFHCVTKTTLAKNKPPLALTIARLDRQKGLMDLLRAATLVPHVHFALVGDGPDRAELECEAQRLNLENRVAFLGHRWDIPALLADCDVFVLPSHYEGLPLAILETMAAGKPIIATAIEGIDEAVVHRETGLLVPPGQPHALAEAIRNLIDQPALAYQFGQAGQTRARQQFSLERMTRQTTELYDAILEAKSR